MKKKKKKKKKNHNILDKKINWKDFEILLKKKKIKIIIIIVRFLKGKQQQIKPN